MAATTSHQPLKLKQPALSIQSKNSYVTIHFIPTTITDWSNLCIEKINDMDLCTQFIQMLFNDTFEVINYISMLSL